jgi:hypothetical protein
MNKINKLKVENQKLRETVRMGEKLIEDILPQMGSIVLQDYDLLNDFLIRAKEAEDAE